MLVGPAEPSPPPPSPLLLAPFSPTPLEPVPPPPPSPIRSADASLPISTVFPLEDLGKASFGPSGVAGFCLDGGGLRGMHLSLRCIAEPDGRPGFELFFWLQGHGVERFAARLSRLGAAPGTLAFSAGHRAEGRLQRDGDSWSPVRGGTQRLEREHSCVELCKSGARTLQGAMRLRVYGDDAAASAELRRLVKQLGMSALLTPPSPEALDRLKRMRLLWQAAPSEADALKARPLGEVSLEGLKKVPKKQAAARLADTLGPEGGASPALLLQLARYALERAPQRFLDWARPAYSAEELAPRGASDAWLTKERILSELEEIQAGPAAAFQALLEGLPATDLGAIVRVLDLSPAELDAVRAATMTPEEAQAVLALAQLARRDPTALHRRVTKELDEVPAEAIDAALARAGVEEARTQGLELQEVAPGYFTVLDPSLPARLEAEGLRYLYSTFAAPEHVAQALLEGQSAALSRFQSGKLIAGKCTWADVELGGGNAVFARAVTSSIAERAAEGFKNWSGSRPYKLILDPSVTARLDAWAQASAGYGLPRSRQKTTELQVRQMQGSGSPNNEIMFPVGVDPSYVRAVSCETAEQRAALLEVLSAEGLTTIAGRPIAEAVRVDAALPASISAVV